jgi:thiol:disulfide interchange protein DsbD
MKLTQMGGKGYGSAFFMGLVAGIIAAPCTGPVLVGILTYVATSGNTFLGVSLLMTYAFGLGLLFLIIGTFSGFISKLPKSGGWMESVKSVFGILLFAFALYYLKEAVDFLKAPLDNSTTNYVIAVVLFVVGAAVGAIHLSYHTHNVAVRARKTVGVVVCVFALYLGIGSITAVHADNIDWVRSIEEGLELAKQENKPVMIDFYADWCTVCKEIEAYTFATDEVGDELTRFVAIKIDLTDNTPENQKIMQLFGIKGLPHIVFFDSKGGRLEDKRLLEFTSKEDFLTHVSDIN